MGCMLNFKCYRRTFRTLSKSQPVVQTVQSSTSPSPPSPLPGPPSFPSHPGTPVLAYHRSEGPLTVENPADCWTGKDICGCRRQLAPDDVLLDIFIFFLEDENIYEGSKKQRIEGWITLAHVCRQWRSVVFQSPLRLNLRLVSTPKTPSRDILDIWPTFPLIIRDFNDRYIVEPSRVGNIIAALKHNDRVCQIELRYGEVGYFANPAVLKPFPELTLLHLSNLDPKIEAHKEELILPDLFLGGSAPRLRSIHIFDHSFSGLPKLLSSVTHLVTLNLSHIPRSGYIPPEAMATSLSALTTLELLWLRFNYPPPRPARETRRPPPPPPLTRPILPSLIKFEFKGTSEYLEKILARIDAPRLDELDITFFNQTIFATPQLFRFISRSPNMGAREKGQIEFKSEAIIVGFLSQEYDNHDSHHFHVGIRCTPSEWQLTSLEQVCTSSFPPVSTLEHLYISENRYDRPDWQDDVDNSLWLDLLRPFVAVKNIYISEEFVPRIAPALQELVGGRTTEVLPALDNIYMEGFLPSGAFGPLPGQEGIDKFVAARRLTSHPVAVYRWDRDPEKEGLRDL